MLCPKPSSQGFRMPKPRLGVDIDGVTCEFFEAFDRWVGKLYDLPPVPADRYDWYLGYPNGGRLWATAHTTGIAEDLYRTAKPTLGAVPTLMELSEKWDIHFLTYRPAFLALTTVNWLDSYGLSFPVSHTDDKSSVPCDLYVDDHTETIKMLHRKGLKALLFRRQWNREGWDLPGVWNWTSLGRKLGLGVAA